MKQGWLPTPNKVRDENDKIMAARQQGMVLFSDFRIMKGVGARKLSTPYKSVLVYHKTAFEDEPQDSNDCTSHGAVNAFDISRAVEIHVRGEVEEFVARGAREWIYAHRGQAADKGMNVGMALRLMMQKGYLLRQKYPFIDFRKYNVQWGIGYGGRKIPQPFYDEAGKHLARYYLRITTVEDMRDAAASGFGIFGGSMYGNSGVRDSKGRSGWDDSWSHCLAVGAADEISFDDLYFLFLNSWGKWNRGGHPDWGPIPGGSWLLHHSHVKRMIQQGEWYAVGNIDGWVPADLPDYGYGSYL